MPISTVPWAPSLEGVADNTPGHTVPFNGPNGEPARTFTLTTTPNATTVQRFIDAAVAWVFAEIGANIPEQFYDVARTAAELRAAGRVLYAYPLRDDEPETAAAMFADSLAYLRSFSDDIPVVGRSNAPAFAFPDLAPYPGPARW